MVHVNDGTLNDEAIIPFGGMGDCPATAAATAARRASTLHRVAVGDGARRAADVPVLSAPTWPPSPTSPGSPASRRRPSRGSSPRRRTRSARDASACPRRRADARLRPERPRPRAAQEPHPGRRGHRPRHHRPVLLGGRPRRRGRGDARRLPRHHLQLGPQRRARERRTSGCSGRCARRRSSSPAAGSTTRRSTPRCASTSRRCGATARPSSTCRRTPSARRRSASTTRPGSPAMVAELVRARTPADRLPGRPDVAVRRAPAARRLSPRSGRGRASRSTSARS